MFTSRRALLGGLATLPLQGSMSRFAVAAESGSLLNVKIVDTAGNMSLVLQQLLKQKGYLEEFGLKADILNVSDGNKVTASLFSGDVDVCMMSGFSSLLPAMERGAKMKVLCGAGTLVGQCIYSKKDDVRELKDLIGRTVGIGAVGALLHEIIVAMLRKHGLDEKKVNFVNVGSNADVFRAVIAGTIDAGPSEIDNIASVDRLGLHVLSDSKCWEQIPEYAWQAGYTSDRAIAEKRDMLVRTLAAFGKLYQFLCGPESFDDFRRARVIALGKKESEDIGEARQFWDFIQKFQGYAHGLVYTKEQIDYVQNLNVSLGVQGKLLPFDQVADMTIAQDALKMISAS